MKNRYIAALLAALLLLPACAAQPSPVEGTTVPAETATPVPTAAITDFVLTRADKDEGMIPTLQDLRKRIAKLCGAELKPGTDFVLQNKIAEPKYEILLGETVRDISQAVYDKLELGGWAVVRTDSKIVIAGRGSVPLSEAIDWFCDNYFVDGAFTFPPEAEHYAVYDYDTFYEVLKGKTINVLGDSYVYEGSLPSGRTWAVLLADKYGMDYRGYGQSGNAIASPTASGTPMYLRYTAMRKKADIVMVVGGRNDYNQRYPVGKVGDTTADTFCGALSILIDGLKKQYPDSLILFSTCWYVHENQKAYSDAMLAVCKEKEIPCFHAADKALSGVCMDNATFRQTYCIKPDDYSHLNDAGMELVMPAYENFIADEAERFFGK